MKFVFLLMFFCFNLFAFEFDFENYSANFKQTIISKDSQISYSGSFIITKNKAFWSYDKPSKKEIFIENNEITMVEHDLEQVTFSTLSNIPNLNEILQNAVKINENKFSAKYENITYLISLKNNEINEISYNDEFENKVILSLNNQIKNQILNENIFKAKYPLNYDLVK